MNSVKSKILISWVGGNDLKAMEGGTAGPIAETLEKASFDAAELLYNYPEEQVQSYLSWLKARITVPIQEYAVKLTSPVDFGEIYQQADKHLARVNSASKELSILLSPGTPAMQAVWILLGKTRYPCRFYQASIEQGVQEVDIPFDLSAEYIPAARDLNSLKISQLAVTEVPIGAAFDNIITRNPRMQTLKAQAQILAEREVPVLIYGETGTGKELFARAIHNAGPRANMSFVAVNCGAIPTELVDSILFGHKKGAFTGATSDEPGVFQQASGGTLFLDEFGELEPSVQVRLLRVLQDGSCRPVGSIEEQEVDIRLITATHRNLMEAVADGTFREDLFYRVAVGVLHLPPLREREGDLLLLAEILLSVLAEKDTGLKHKNISPNAKNIILSHPWQGNVRELQSTLLRSALWCQGKTITASDIRQALFQMPEKEPSVLEKDVAQGIDIQSIMGDVARIYIRRTLEYTGHNKTRAAKLLGLKNYQTLNNWIEKYHIS
ncbi:sigma 54-interacting transcriptional regulator [Desulfogranum marinum]|uniref:sigma-54 interaction domain-containing protein n=1 Tax=Desulfogranum marinum TaxID=453220 RepID=UPI0029C7FC65|nr:sigma 54-interacting transcriptional regulator [Desulfogranum marinum]